MGILDPLVFDHLTLNARDKLDSCCAVLATMGFHLTPPSFQSIGAVNRCAVLEGAYLEVIAINQQAAQPRLELLHQPLGLNAIVFRVADAEACYADLLTKGFPALPVQAFSRMAKNSAGDDREASFRVVRFESQWAAQALPFGRVYFCQHLSPELVFDPGFVRHTNACRAFAAVVIEIRHLAPLSDLARRMFGNAWSETASEATLHTQGLQIHFVQSSQDRIVSCTFAPQIGDPKIFENSYGRFIL
jgi:Glyoxalase-like domain